MGFVYPFITWGGTTLYILIWPFLHDRRTANDTPFFERPCIPSSVGKIAKPCEDVKRSFGACGQAIGIGDPRLKSNHCLGICPHLLGWNMDYIYIYIYDICVQNWDRVTSDMIFRYIGGWTKKHSDLSSKYRDNGNTTHSIIGKIGI